MTRNLLALCARDIGSDLMYGQLQEHLRVYAEQNLPWDVLLHEAELHGVAPLLHKHLSHLGMAIPRHARRQLQSLSLRTRQANAIRNEEIASIVRTLQGENIEVVLAKGIALANLVYSDPGLRPMRDIDLLVSNADTARTSALLADLGYLPEKHSDIPDDYYHLVPVAKIVEGMTVTIEVHRNLLPLHAQYPRWPLERSLDSALPFVIQGAAVRTLSLEDMLWHVYLHGFQPPLTYEPFRLMHVADMVSLVVKFLDDIDWPELRRTFPTVVNVLSCFHWLTPWPEPIAGRLGLDTENRPDNIGVPYQGWPLRRLGTVRGREYLRLARETLWPSEWWMRVYGHLEGIGYLKARWVDHPRTLVRWGKSYWLHYLRGRRSEG